MAKGVFFMEKTGHGEVAHVHGGKKLQLRIASRAIGTHRRAIGREATNYLWWLLALAVALMILGIYGSFTFWAQAVIVMVGCLGGAVVALIACRVIRREVEVLDDACKIYDRLAEAMDLEGGALAAPGRPNKGLGGLLRGVLGAKDARMETWDWFQFTFVLAAVMYFVGFIGALLYALLK